MEGRSVRIVHRGGTVKTGVLVKWDEPVRPIVVLRFPIACFYRANLNHGWLAPPAEDWRVHPDDLAELRAWANRCEHWVHVVPRRGPLPPKPKTAPPVSKKQLGFGWDDK